MPDTVLVVDDEEQIRNTLRGVLADEGFEVIEAADGRQALDLLQRTSSSPACGSRRRASPSS